MKNKNKNQKNDAPPRLESRGLRGARFLDARESPRSKERGFQDSRHNEFWGVTTFFNPAHYKNKYQNYKIFREQSKKQGLKLIAVELAFKGADFELKKGDAEKIIRVRSDSIMWQRERLLNIALSHLPKKCNKFAWLDADLIFKNPFWIRKTSDLLDDYKIVQLFQYVFLLNENKFDAHGRIENGEKRIGEVYNEKTNLNLKPHSGFAWAARKSVFKKIGFYDKMVLGSGDILLLDAFRGIEPDVTKGVYYLVSNTLRKEFLEWQKEIRKRVNKKYTYLQGDILHLNHGALKNRLYSYRLRILSKYSFDPCKDLRINKSGGYEWATSKNELHEWVEDYFKLRNEENKHAKLKGCLYNLLDILDVKFGILNEFAKKNLPNLHKKLKALKTR